MKPALTVALQNQHSWLLPSPNICPLVRALLGRSAVVLSPPFPFASSLPPSLSLTHTHLPVLFLLHLLSIPAPHPPISPRAARIRLGGGGRETSQRKVSLHQTRIERRRERRGAEGFAEMGTVCLFAGGCCCSPFPAFHMCTLELPYAHCRTQSHNK